MRGGSRAALRFRFVFRRHKWRLRTGHVTGVAIRYTSIVLGVVPALLGLRLGVFPSAAGGFLGLVPALLGDVLAAFPLLARCLAGVLLQPLTGFAPCAVL